MVPSPSEPSDPGLRNTAAWEADAELIRGLLRRDPRCTQAFLDRLDCLARILSSINSQYGGVLDAEELADLAQDTAVIVLRKLDTFRAISSLETWVFGIASLEFMNAFRRKLRTPVPIGELLPDEQVDESANEFAELEDACVLLQALGGLDPIDRRIVERRTVHGDSFETIAEQERLSPSAVKARHYRALERLRQKFGNAPNSLGADGEGLT